MPAVQPNKGILKRISTKRKNLADLEENEIFTGAILQERLKGVDVREGRNALAQPLRFILSDEQNRCFQHALI